MEVARKRLIIVTVASIIGIFAIYHFLFAALTGELGKRYLECKECEADALCARNLIESMRIIGVKCAVLTEEDSSLAIDELTKEGKEKRINFISITPKENEKKKEDQYEILPIRMEIESTYEDLGAFLGVLDELENSLVTVSSFEVTPCDEKKATVLETELVINMYLFGEKYAE